MCVRTSSAGGSRRRRCRRTPYGSSRSPPRGPTSSTIPRDSSSAARTWAASPSGSVASSPSRCASATCSRRARDPTVVQERRPMSVAREGGCSCGAVRYRLASDPMFVHCCHCLNCQRQTGSAFVINLLIEADRGELLARHPPGVDVPRDDGSRQRVYRCPDCQVAVFSEYGRPEVSFVRAGTL